MTKGGVWGYPESDTSTGRPYKKGESIKLALTERHAKNIQAHCNIEDQL